MFAARHEGSGRAPLRYALPRVDAVAVGTDNVDHLRELIGALAYEVDDQMVREYRQLLQARRQPD